MLRDQALLKVAELIVHTRQETYGDSVSQLANCTRIKYAVGHHDSLNLNDTEREAIDMICTKLSRIARGKPHEDNWLDIIGYAAIAVESRHIEIAGPIDDEIVDEGTRALAEKLSPFRRKND